MKFCLAVLSKLFEHFTDTEIRFLVFMGDSGESRWKDLNW